MENRAENEYQDQYKRNGGAAPGGSHGSRGGVPSGPHGPRGGFHGGPRGAGGGEKAKDLVGTWKKLLGYCRRYMAVFVTALLCSAAGTVLTLIGPDKLSEMTDVITEGIAPDTEMLEEIMEAVLGNPVPYSDVVVEGVTISGEDQAAMMALFAELNSEGMQSMDGRQPAEGIPPMEGGQSMEGEQSTEGMPSMKGGISGENQEALLEAMEKLPDSVYSLIKPSIDMDRVFHIGFILIAFSVIS